MKKILIQIAVMMAFVLAANVQVYALSSALDIEALKDEIKKEIKSERPWMDELENFKFDIHGFVSQGYMNTDRYNYLLHNSKGGSFQFNEIGINFSKQLTDKLRIGIQFLARDLGDIGNDDPEIDWAFADYHWQDWLGFRVGVLKVPNGLYNETRDVDMLRTCILLPDALYNESTRDIYTALTGVGIYGSLPLAGAGSIDYQLMMGTQNNEASDSGVAKEMEDVYNLNLSISLLSPPLASAITTSDFDISSFDVEEMYIGSLQWRSPFGLRLGGTINFLKYSTGGNYLLNGTSTDFDVASRARVFTLSAEQTWRDLIMAAEYWQLRSDSKLTWAGISGAPILVLPTSMSDLVRKEGWYFSGSYRVNEWFEIGAYNSIVHHFQKSKGWSKDYALSTRFDINEFWTVKMEAHRIRGKGTLRASENDNYASGPNGFYAFVAKITFSF